MRFKIKPIVCYVKLLFDTKNNCMDNIIMTLRINNSFIRNLSKIETQIKQIEEQANRTLTDNEIELLLKILSR